MRPGVMEASRATRSTLRCTAEMGAAQAGAENSSRTYSRTMPKERAHEARREQTGILEKLQLAVKECNLEAGRRQKNRLLAPKRVGKSPHDSRRDAGATISNPSTRWSGRF